MDLNNVTGWNFTGNLWVPPQQNEARVRINWNEMNEAVNNAVKKENGLWKVKFGSNPTAVFFSKDQAQKFAERQYHNSITGQASVFNARPTVTQQPVIQQPTVQPTAVQQPVIQQPTVQPTAVQQPAIQQPTVQPTVSNAQPQTNNTAQITPRKKYTWANYAQEHGTTYTKPPKSGAVIADEKAAQIIAKNAEKAAQQTITLTPNIPTKPKYIVPTSSYLSDNIANTPAVETTIQEAPITSEAVGTDKMQTATKTKTQQNSLKLKNNPELAKRYESYCKTVKKSNTLKALKKAGKWGALTALAIGTVITAVQACKGGQKDDAVKPETPKSEAPKKETSATAPVKEDTPANTTAPTPAAPAAPTEPEKSSEIGVGEFKDGKYKVKKGDSFWNIAEKNLIEEYKKAQTAKNEAIDENYKPTDAEILKETERLVAKNEYEFDEKHWNTTKPIYEGDILNIAA